MSEPTHVDVPDAERREQPFLYAWNRRLRHLHGVSLRNLNITSPKSRSRGKTITDDEYNLKTAAKSLIQDERQKLHHARSYDQLLKVPEGPDSFQSPPRAVTAKSHGGEELQRPLRAPMRRRSTLHWATSNPRARQSKLEAVEVDRLVTTWFSIHGENIDQPLYISEVMDKSMNPSFSFFDLDSTNTTITRSDTFILRVWSKSELMDQYRVLVELTVNMRSLQFIGKSLEAFHHPLPENCVLFHLSDGIYTSFTDMPAETSQLQSLTAPMKAMAPTQAASFDTLLKLANLDDVIQDALRTRAKLEADINQLLVKTPPSEGALPKLSSRREEVRNAKRASENEQKNLEHVARAKSELHSALNLRREMLNSLASRQSQSDENCKKFSSSIQRMGKDLDNIVENSSAQIRRICSSLLQMYPIEPVKNKTLQFTIRNVYLPNSSYNDTNSDEIAAALGYTAQLVHRLSLYLSVPLPYPIELNESNSSIRDDISAGLAQRQFPLHPAGPAYKFEYGVFLLNKNIEVLMNRSGLRVMDIRHTLPNLKYLMFVLTAGSGELPSRKVGGIRGLLRGRMTPSMSRRNSEESVTSQVSTTFSDSKFGQQEKIGDDDIFNGPVRARGLPYRRSMLRDAG